MFFIIHQHTMSFFRAHAHGWMNDLRARETRFRPFIRTILLVNDWDTTYRHIYHIYTYTYLCCGNVISDREETIKSRIDWLNSQQAIQILLPQTPFYRKWSKQQYQASLPQQLFEARVSQGSDTEKLRTIQMNREKQKETSPIFSQSLTSFSFLPLSLSLFVSACLFIFLPMPWCFFNILCFIVFFLYNFVNNVFFHSFLYFIKPGILIHVFNYQFLLWLPYIYRYAIGFQIINFAGGS